MSKNPLITQALQRMASLSAESAKIVEGLTGNDVSETSVESLTKKIDHLVAENKRLRHLLYSSTPVQSDVVISDEEQAEFAATFSAYLKATPSAAQGWNAARFHPYSPAVRVAIASALIDFCVSNNLTVADVWRDIVACSGHL